MSHARSTLALLCAINFREWHSGANSVGRTPHKIGALITLREGLARTGLTANFVAVLISVILKSYDKPEEKSIFGQQKLTTLGLKK
jgi:hypothetical protein